MDDATKAFLAELERSDELNFTDNELTVPAGQRPCPICGNKMEVETMSGVDIDVCGNHGVWLDRSELPSILARARAKRCSQSRIDAIRRARTEGKKSGIMFGYWSLLFD